MGQRRGGVPGGGWWHYIICSSLYCQLFCIVEYIGGAPQSCAAASSRGALKIWNDFLHVVYVVWSLDSSWVFFNFNFRFGDLSDFKRRICWPLHCSFANLKTLAHFENLERCFSISISNFCKRNPEIWNLRFCMHDFIICMHASKLQAHIECMR